MYNIIKSSSYHGKSFVQFLQRTVNKIHANKKFRFRVAAKKNSSSEGKNLVTNEAVSCEKKEVSRETCREDVPKRNSDTISSLTFVTTPVITDSPVRCTQTVHSEKLMENSMTSQKREEVKAIKGWEYIVIVIHLYGVRIDSIIVTFYYSAC